MKPTREELIAALTNIEAHVSYADVLFDPSPRWEGEQDRYDTARKSLDDASALLIRERKE
jgi:hypothetical protein